MKVSEVRSPSAVVHSCADPLDLGACLGKRRAIGQQQFRAKLGQYGGGGAADAAGRAGDQRAPAAQVQRGR